jgi:hypothetical protein
MAHFFERISEGANTGVKRTTLSRLLKPRCPDDCPCTGYLVYLFQKSGIEQSYKNHIIMCLVSGEQRTGTVMTL